MPKFTRSALLAAGILGLGLLTNAAASGLSGSYNYTYTGDTSDLSCSSTTRNNFSSTSGSNSIATDPVAFSICAGVPGALNGGQFTITDGTGDTASGIFNGTYVGLSGGNGAIFDGLFDVTSTSGYYDPADGATGYLQVVTGNVNNIDTNPGDYLTGTFSFSTPEPASIALGASGLLALLFGKRRNRR